MRQIYFSEWPIEEFMFNDICVAYVGNCWPTSLYFSDFDCHDHLATASTFHDVAFVSFYNVLLSAACTHELIFGFVQILTQGDLQRHTAKLLVAVVSLPL